MGMCRWLWLDHSIVSVAELTSMFNNKGVIIDITRMGDFRLGFLEGVLVGAMLGGVVAYASFCAWVVPFMRGLTREMRRALGRSCERRGPGLRTAGPGTRLADEAARKSR